MYTLLDRRTPEMKPKKRGSRILVADDDLAVLRLVENALLHFGYLVQGCDSGAEVLKRAEPGAFELLVMDYRIGAPDGLKVLQKLRTRGVETSAILMSSHFPEGITRLCARMTDVSLLQKPFSLDALRAAIRHALGAGPG